MRGQGATRGLKRQKPIAEDDPLGIEAAFEKNTSAFDKRTSFQNDDADDDPLGLESAFDAACPGGAFPEGGDGDSSDSTEHVASEEESELDESQDGLAPGANDEDNLSDVSNVAGDDDDDDDDVHGQLFSKEDRLHARRLRKADGFERATLKLNWRGKQVGNLTAWGANLSCVCKLHPKCKSPASKIWPSDKFLEDWILMGLKVDGDLRLDKDEHQRIIREAHEKLRASR